MDNQRLRNLTTVKLHTKIEDIYEDLERISGIRGIYSHMLPRVRQAVKPWLMKHVKDYRFFNNEYDPGHVGSYDLPEPTRQERAEIMKKI